MKTLFVLSLVLVMVLLTACAPTNAAVQKAVELPAPLQLFILSTVTLFVTFIFTKLAEIWKPLGDFLGQYVDEVSTAAAGALVFAVQNYLNAIPPEWEGVANAALALLVAILAVYGFVKGARKALFMFAAYRLTNK